MSLRLNSTVARAFSVPVFAILLAAQAPARAAESPFNGLAGAWSGTGQILLSSGAKERIRCRSNYTPDAAGANLRIELRCASDSFKFELKSDVSHNAGQVSGAWSETTRGAIGTISGTASNGHFDVRANGPTFSAMLSLTTRGNRQAISISAPGSEFSQVTISLNKGGK